MLVESMAEFFTGVVKAFSELEYFEHDSIPLSRDLLEESRHAIGS